VKVTARVTVGVWESGEEKENVRAPDWAYKAAPVSPILAKASVKVPLEVWGSGVVKVTARALLEVWGSVAVKVTARADEVV